MKSKEQIQEAQKLQQFYIRNKLKDPSLFLAAVAFEGALAWVLETSETDIDIFSNKTFDMHIDKMRKLFAEETFIYGKN